MSALTPLSTTPALPRTARMPPGPSEPRVLQTLRFGRDPLGYARECARRFGDIFTLRLAGFPGDGIALVSSPALVRELFTAPPEVARAGLPNGLGFGYVVGTRSLLVLDGPDHLTRRRLLLPSFHAERIQEYGRAMEEVTERLIATWPRRRPFAAHPELQRIALQVLMRTVFGIEDPAAEAAVQVSATRIVNEALSSVFVLMPSLRWDLGPLSPWGRIVRILEEADAVLHDLIRRRRASAARRDRAGTDILSLLIEARDESGQGLDDDELRDELVTMLFAGHETTGTTLAWAMECILGRPAIERGIREELDRVVGRGPLGTDQLAGLEYLDAVIKEVLRYRPIMTMAGTRSFSEPYALGGHLLPAGAVVASCPPVLHHRPELYPEPDRFEPERFLGKKPDPYAFAPFGGGGRRCLGMSFALLEMKVVLATIFRRARLALRQERVRPVIRGFFVGPDKGLRIELLGTDAAV